MFIGLTNFFTNQDRPNTSAPEMAWNIYVNEQ